MNAKTIGFGGLALLTLCVSCGGDAPPEEVGPPHGEGTPYPGACVVWLTTNAVSTPRVVTRVTYDEVAPLPSRIRNYDDQGVLEREDVFRYSSSGKLLEHDQDRDGDGALDKDQTCSSEDERGRCVWRRTSTLGQEEASTTQYAYDEEDRILELLTDDESDGVWESIFTWEYEGTTTRWRHEERDTLTDTWSARGGVDVTREDGEPARKEYWTEDPITSERTGYTVTYTYGEGDELLSVSGGTSSERYTYDQKLRPLTFERTSAEDGEVLETQTWTYDDDTRTETRVEVEGSETTIERTVHEANGQRLSKHTDEQGDGHFEIERTYEDDRMVRLRRDIQGEPGAFEVLQRAYDAAGNVLTSRESIEGGEEDTFRLYTYDYGCFEGAPAR